MGDWVFGCDICQDVCPFNQGAPEGQEPAYEPSERNPLVPLALLDEVAHLSEEQYQSGLAGSAMKRATLDMLKRNATIAARNNDR